MSEFDEIAKSQQAFYSTLYRQHGFSPEAVGSEVQSYKELRYEKLSKVFGTDANFTLHDIGMGLGHYYEFLKSNYLDRNIVYSGSDVVEDFVTFCRRQYPECEFHHRDVSRENTTATYDYVVLAGTFYHKETNTTEEWWSFVERMLQSAFWMANRGIAVNMNTQFCDYFRDELFYCDIPRLLDLVSSRMSRFFTIDHAYPLYEFTLCVYKPAIVRQAYPHSDFDKWFRP